MTAADAWMEECLIAISVQGGSDVQFAGLTETVDFDIGEKDIEQIVLVNGGRVTKWMPEGISSVTFEAYPLEAGTASGSSGLGFYDLVHSQDASQPVRILNDRVRSKYRCLFLWTSDTSITTAQATVTGSHKAFRIGLADGHFTSVKPAFTDGILKFTVTYKTTPFDKSADSNVMMESTDSTAALPAIASYTSSAKFD